MKKINLATVVLGLCLMGACAKPQGAGCLVGAFLADRPGAAAIDAFQKDYGKKPYLVLVFLDWGKYPDENVIRDVYDSGSVLMITWEPWIAAEKKGIDIAALVSGKDDAYLRAFAGRLKAIEKPVFLRFAHEMNGDWYPWSAAKIGKETYVKMFRHVREVFDSAGARNVRWVFSINAENIPATNDYGGAYPGDPYVDSIGLDGYNWGTTQSWSRWQSFKEIFSGVYQEVRKRYAKPVLISEFSSASAGGDKAAWIEDALETLRDMPAVKAFILFNVDKETDWGFAPVTVAGQRLRLGMAKPYFLESPERILE